MCLLEVVVFDVKSAFTAALCGADRLEVCDNHQDGGTTPSLGTISVLMDKLELPIFPMIRPRGGDFLYTDDEIDVMMKDIRAFKSLGCQGVVLGILQRDGTVDYSNLSRLVSAAYPMDVTFHRAFDRVRDFEQALNLIYQAGCVRVLTSGGRPTVREGLKQLKTIQSLAKGKLKVIAGGGVDLSVVPELIKLDVDEIHTPAKRKTTSTMDFVNINLQETLDWISIDEEMLKNIVALVKYKNNFS